MKTYKWMPGWWFYLLSMMVFVLIGGPMVSAQEVADVYPVRNVVATSNAISQEDEGPENTVNSSGLNSDNEHSTASSDMWLVESPDEPVYIQYAFDAVYTLQEMWVWNWNTRFEVLLGFGVKEATIEYSEDGQLWTVCDDVEFAQAPATEDYNDVTIVALNGIAAKYIRLSVLSTWGGFDAIGLSEVRFWTDDASLADPTGSYVQVLDDFEAYDDIESRIFEFWVDCWVNETGSIVGYMAAPFAELEIVNSGLQAMPLFYDNRMPPYYSETQRTLETDLEDWLTGGAEALTLYFHGNADNGRGTDDDRLYVAIEDDRGIGAVVYHSDPEALFDDDWQAWTIDFAEFEGVDLYNVEFLMLGVGDRDYPRRGGSGVVYIDDIGLTMIADAEN